MYLFASAELPTCLGVPGNAIPTGFVWPEKYPKKFAASVEEASWPGSEWVKNPLGYGDPAGMSPMAIGGVCGPWVRVPEELESCALRTVVLGANRACFHSLESQPRSSIQPWQLAPCSRAECWFTALQGSWLLNSPKMGKCFSTRKPTRECCQACVHLSSPVVSTQDMQDFLSPVRRIPWPRSGQTIARGSMARRRA